MRFITRKHVALEAEGHRWKKMLVIETELQLDATDPDYDEDSVAELMREAFTLSTTGGFDGCTITRTRRWHRPNG
jgi:hypothetical protein